MPRNYRRRKIQKKNEKQNAGSQSTGIRVAEGKKYCTTETNVLEMRACQRESFSPMPLKSNNKRENEVRVSPSGRMHYCTHKTCLNIEEKGPPP